MDDLDEGMRVFFVGADAKNETDGFVKCKIDLFKIPTFEIVSELGIALKKKGML